jgi:hypothetical protein
MSKNQDSGSGINIPDPHHCKKVNKSHFLMLRAEGFFCSLNILYAWDPDPDSLEMLDPDPYPDSLNPDPDPNPYPDSLNLDLYPKDRNGL